MKIPLQFLQRQLQAIALVRFTGSRPKMEFIRFVIDTGSAISTLGLRDSESLGLNFSTLPSMGVTKVGGQSFELRKISPVAFVFNDNNGNPCRFSFADLRLTCPLKKNAADRQEAESIPSILGMDFLEASGLALYVKPVSNAAYFDDEVEPQGFDPGSA